MPYVTVPRDISKVKAKFLFGLTKRQLVCIGLAVVAGAPVFLLLMMSMGTQAMYPAMIIAMPFFLAAFYTPRDGQPLEKSIMNYIRVRYILPRVRPYQTVNVYRQLTLLSEIQEVIISANAEAEESTADAANAKRRNRNKKN